MNKMVKEDGREARKHASRARLIETGFALLKSAGPDALTMRGLAKAANMAPATAYNVFGSKQALFEAMFNQLNDQGPETDFANLPGDELERVLAITDQISRDWADPKGPQRVLLEASKLSGSLASVLFPKVIPRLTTLIDALKTAGWLTNGISSTDLANRIGYANAGLFEAWLDGRVRDEELLREHRLNLLVILLGAACHDKRSRIEDAIFATLRDQQDG